MAESEDRATRSQRAVVFGMGSLIGIGAGVGLVFGLLFDNMVLGMLFGAAIGTVAGAVVESTRRASAPKE